LADLLERLAHTNHCEIHFFAQVTENLDVAPPNSEHSDESCAILSHKIPGMTWSLGNPG
jgi:hypothetical protein